MSKRIKVADLPEFDAAHYLDSETAIARCPRRTDPASECRAVLKSENFGNGVGLLLSVGSRTGAVFCRFSLSVALRFL
jgi:hypothetical protein